MDRANQTTNSNRSDSTKSQSVLSDQFPEGVFLTYAPEDCDYELRYSGSAYIKCDYSAALRDGRDFTCQEAICVYDDTNSEITLTSFADFAEVCENYVQEREAMCEDGEGDE